MDQTTPISHYLCVFMSVLSLMLLVLDRHCTVAHKNSSTPPATCGKPTSVYLRVVIVEFHEGSVHDMS